MDGLLAFLTGLFWVIVAGAGALILLGIVISALKLLGWLLGTFLRSVRDAFYD